MKYLITGSAYRSLVQKQRSCLFDAAPPLIFLAGFGLLMLLLLIGLIALIILVVKKIRKHK
jgi:hypothetical protein